MSPNTRSSLAILAVFRSGKRSSEGLATHGLEVSDVSIKTYPPNFTVSLQLVLSNASDDMGLETIMQIDLSKIQYFFDISVSIPRHVDVHTCSRMLLRATG
jgi:hypothetical protein